MTIGTHTTIGPLMQPLSLLRFRTQDVNFAMDVRRVEHILDTRQVRRVDEEGVAVGNLAFYRDAVIPVVDLRGEAACAGPESPLPLIVLSLRQQLVGIIVQQVGDVIDVPALDIEPAQFDGSCSAEYVDGIISNDEGKTLVVDIGKLLYPLEQERG